MNQTRIERARELLDTMLAYESAKWFGRPEPFSKEKFDEAVKAYQEEFSPDEKALIIEGDHASEII